jgi:hypothetical protein
MFQRPMRRAGPVIRMLQSPNPNQRMRAVQILGGRRRPRAAWLLNQVAQHDPNPQIRAQAQQYVNEWGKPLLDQFRANNHKPDPSQRLWECEFCGTKDVKGGMCPNCGAPRPDAADED